MSGNVYVAYGNLLTNGTTLIYANDESTVYPVANLQYRQLDPPFRSADYCLNLNGTDERASLASHADFNITGNLTIEALVAPAATAATAVAVFRWASNTGYSLYWPSNLIPVIKLDSSIFSMASALSTGVWTRLQAVLDASAQKIRFFANGSQVGSDQPGPASITGNSQPLGVFANTVPGGWLPGSVGYVAIANAVANGAPLNPAVCAGYWPCNGLDGGLLPDISGKGHHLTVHNIDESNFAACTARQVLFCDLGSARPATLLFLDRRHNLSSGADIRLEWSTSQYGATTASETISSITAGEAVVKRFSTHNARWVRIWINDPANADGYIEIPYMYLGGYTTLQRNPIIGYGHFPKKRAGVVNETSNGNLVGYAKSDAVHDWKFSLRCNATDYSTIMSLLDEAGLCRPFVICLDDDDEYNNTHLVQLQLPFGMPFTHVVGTIHMVEFDIKEMAGGV